MSRTSINFTEAHPLFVPVPKKKKPRKVSDFVTLNEDDYDGCISVEMQGTIPHLRILPGMGSMPTDIWKAIAGDKRIQRRLDSMKLTAAKSMTIPDTDTDAGKVAVSGKQGAGAAA